MYVNYARHAVGQRIWAYMVRQLKRSVSMTQAKVRVRELGVKCGPILVVRNVYVTLKLESRWIQSIVESIGKRTFVYDFDDR